MLIELHDVWLGDRGAILVRLRHGGLVGEGEASPLPGYSPDDLDSCRAALRDTGPTTPAAELARFAARLDLEGKRRGLPAHALLGASRTALPLATLVSDIDAAAAAWRRGVRTLKVKIGRDHARDGDLLATIRERFPEAELRLDANGRAVDTHDLARFAPVYIEEPLDPHGPIPVALDESLQRLPDDAIEARLSSGAIAALVLKPMTLGPERCFALARRAAAHDVPVTVTHTLDGPLGLAAAAALALALPGRILAVGLDRHAGLAAWPPAHIAALADAEIRATAAPGLGVTWG